MALLVSGFLAQPVGLAEQRGDVAVPEPGDPALSWTPPMVHVLTMFTVVRGAESVLWPEPFAETDPKVWASHYEEAFTRPPVFDPDQRAFSWDGDRWEINVIGHGLMGSEAYLRARQCRFGWAGSFALAAASTAVWEYGFEANGVRPSAQDLVYTPVAGLALGEARYLLWRSAADVRHPSLRALLRGVVDPFGELSRGVGLFDC